jgi:hypothetical protein
MPVGGARWALRGGPAAGLGGDFLCGHVEIQLDRELASAAGGERIGRRWLLEIGLGRSCDRGRARR